MGELNTCTTDDTGWTSDHCLFSTTEPLVALSFSDCEGKLDAEGRNLFQIGSAAELRILNGLKLVDRDLRKRKLCFP